MYVFNPKFDQEKSGSRVWGQKRSKFHKRGTQIPLGLFLAMFS